MVSRSTILSADQVLRLPLRASQQIRLTVTSSAAPSPTTGGYIYTYAVSSEPSNKVGIELFGLRSVPPPDSVVSPEQWEDFYGFDEEDSAVVWGCADSMTQAPPEWDSVQVYSSPYEIQPGDSKTFVLFSKRPPAPSVEYRALGFDSLPPAGAYSAGDEGTADYPSLWLAGVAGTAWGPDIASVVGVDAEHSPELPVGLRAPVPNPTTGTAGIAFWLARAARVNLSVYDVRGRLVKVLVKGDLPSGYHASSWAGQTVTGGEAASGVYFFKLRADGKEIGRRKIVLVR
jgi:hypothetical protein